MCLTGPTSSYMTQMSALETSSITGPGLLGMSFLTGDNHVENPLEQNVTGLTGPWESYGSYSRANHSRGRHVTSDCWRLIRQTLHIKMDSKNCSVRRPLIRKESQGSMNL